MQSPSTAPQPPSISAPASNDSLAGKCEWLKNNFPQTKEAVASKYGLPSSSKIELFVEECGNVANGFYMRGNVEIELPVPPEGCIDSSKSAYYSGPTVSESFGGLRAYSGTVRSSNIALRVALCEYHP